MNKKYHIRQQGERYKHALALADLFLRNNDSLTGMPKVRVDIATWAALRATGFETKTDTYVIPSDFGPFVALAQDIAAEAADDACRHVVMRLAEQGRG